MKIKITQTATITREIDVPVNMPNELAIAQFGMESLCEDGVTISTVGTVADSVKYEITVDEKPAEPAQPIARGSHQPQRVE